MQLYAALVVAGYLFSAVLFGVWCAIAKTVYDAVRKRR